MSQWRYRIGIDVGLNSVGLAAVEIDANAGNPLEEVPISILNAQSVIHDGGVDPEEAKTSTSRRATAGVARRTRRLHARRRERLRKLDTTLSELGYPVVDFSQFKVGTNPYIAWQTRARLVQERIEDDDTRKQLISIAVRHIARHRGWRNPYSSVTDVLEKSSAPSLFMVEFSRRLNREIHINKADAYWLDPWRTEQPDGSKLTKEELAAQPATETWSDAPIDGRTTAELICGLLTTKAKIRRSQDKGRPDALNIQIAKLHQSDNAHELTLIFERQGVDTETRKRLFEAVFDSTNPRSTKAAAKRVGLCPLAKQVGRVEYRASRATLAFQEYRLMATIDNLRLRQDGHERNLNIEERQRLFDGVRALPVKARKGEVSIKDFTWGDAAELLGVERAALRGVGGQTRDGEPVSAKQPPVISTNEVIMSSAPTPVREWWAQAGDFERDRLVESLSNAGAIEDKSALAKEVDTQIDSLLSELDEEGQAELEKMTLASGRAAYSAQTLRELTKRMYETGEDLTTARQSLFGVDEYWVPPAPPIYEQTGNPSVDRTLKIIHRWLSAVRREFGEPQTVNVEYVRQGFSSVRVQNDEQREMDRRYKNNQEVLAQYPGASSRSDVRRIRAIQRQNSKCAYCDNPITFQTCQMDHIVPQKGVGSDSKYENLVATCGRCNLSKGNRLFIRWIEDPKVNWVSSLDEIVQRIEREWNPESWMVGGKKGKQWKLYAEAVKSRLLATEESEPLDNRSMESVAWMARELRARINGFYGWNGNDDDADKGTQKVFVSSGSMTAKARRTPFESPLVEGADIRCYEAVIPWIDGMEGKTRLDRRHHAVDACVIALMRPQIVRILTQAQKIRETQQLDYRKGAEPEELKSSPNWWRNWRGEPGSQDEAVFDWWAGQQLRTLAELVSEAFERDEIPVVYPTRLRLGNGSAHLDTVAPMMTRKVGDAFSIVAINKASSAALYTALTRDPDFDPREGLPANPSRRIRLHDRWLDASDDIGFLEPAGKDSAALDKQKDSIFVPVRGGIAGAGISIHHVRFYRIPKLNSKGVQTGQLYAMLRVLLIDLQKNEVDKRNGKKRDLFTLELPESSLTRRFADAKLRQALIEGTAEYLGWAVQDDELEVPVFGLSRCSEEELAAKTAPEKINYSFQGSSLWRFRGFGHNGQLTISPLRLAAEGLYSSKSKDDKRVADRFEIMQTRQLRLSRYSERYVKGIETIINNGFGPSPNMLLQTGIRVIDRDSLGRPRVRWSTVAGEEKVVKR